MTSRSIAICCVVPLACFFGCSGTDTSSGPGSGGSSDGGASNTGGQAVTGGATNNASSSAVGGIANSGGSNASGGLPTAGGNATTGGSLSAGGNPSSGGSQSAGATGGTTNPSAGGSASGGASSMSGGATALGGAASTGGVTAIGGTTSTAGTAIGGATATGGSKTSGGTSAIGGSASTGGNGSTGGSNANGGSATGGIASTGGSKATGGSPATGGANTGGANTGGGVNTGGTTGTVTCKATGGSAGNAAWDAPGNMNPIVPGYFADGSVRKFGDTYYLYATTDGVKNAAGDPSIWASKDFVNWYNIKITMPTGSQTGPGSAWAWWAPDVAVGPDGKYYYYHANSNLAIYGASSTTPTGPWTSMGSVIPNNYVAGVLTLDGQTFTDTDGSMYAYFCTWASSNSGCGWAKFNSDMRSFSSSGLIANAQLGSGLNIGEGPFMLKANSKYYFMYSNGSCFDSSYAVRYSTGTSPTGPFTYAKQILGSSSDGRVDGPGHHSVLVEGSNYYIIYHRHDNPHSTGGEFRQECADKMTFDSSGNINTVTPTQSGVGYLATNQNPNCNLAYTQTVTASSYYHDTARNFDFLPKYAVDDNNGTIWKAGDSFMGHWLRVDLGSVQPIAQTMVQFEYPTYFYQYKIEYSTDGTAWSIYADRTTNKIPGSPMVDTVNASARYLRLTITGVEKPGMYAAVWNFKAYAATSAFNPPANAASTAAVAPSRGNLLIKLDASALAAGTITSWANQGSLGGTFNGTGTVQVQTVSGRQAVTFNGSSQMQASFNAPVGITWNSPFSSVAWVYNPAVGTRECIAAWAPRGGPTAAFSAQMYGTDGNWGAAAHWDAMDMPYATTPSAGAWHHIALIFDGQVEKVYVDGTLNNQEQKYLNVWPNGPVIIGNSGATDVDEHLSGSIASYRMYDVALDAAGVTALMNGTEPTLPSPPPAP